MIDRPRLVGSGPATFSTSMEIAVYPLWIVDVNGYYADLGVGTRAGRGEIREAYLARDGASSARLTYVVKQLLNPAIRRAYDITPLGSIFYDFYVDENLRRVAAQRLSQGGGTLSIAVTSLVEVPDESAIDTAGRQEQSPSNDGWPYAYYLWRSDSADTVRLREWQELLVRTLGRRKEHLELAVGFVGGAESPVEVISVGFRVVVFLRDDESPTDALAQRAVSQLIEQRIEECQTQQVDSARAQRPRRRRLRAETSPRPTTSRWMATPTPPRTPSSSAS